MKTTKGETFRARAERLAKRLEKDGPDTERLRLAIREGLLVSGGKGHAHRGGAVDQVIHLANLVAIMANTKQEPDRRGIEDCPEPEHALWYLAVAAERLEGILAAVEQELEHAERDLVARRRSA